MPGGWLGVAARCGSMGAPMSEGPGDAAWNSRASGDAPGAGPGLGFVSERVCVRVEATETG